MCEAFRNLGVEITLAVPESKQPMSESAMSNCVQSKIGRGNQYPIITFPKFMPGGRLNSLGGYWGARKVMRQADADICFVRSAQFYNIATGLGLPTIFESHNYLLHNHYKFLDGFWRNRLLKASRSKTTRLFVSISQALTNYWVEQGVRSTICLSLHDGVDLEAFKVEVSQREARERLGLDKDKKIAVYAGSLYADRGIENIFSLARRFPEVLFLILGGPDDRRTYLEKAMRGDGIKNVKFKGWVEKETVRLTLFAADILLLLFTNRVPTINYCSPLKMFEYMASGRVIVGHAFPTIKEVLTDGDTAFLADPASFDQLCLKVSQALCEEYPTEMAERARTLALREYTWQSRATAIYRKLNN